MEEQKNNWRCIYKITNNINKKSYIGQTKNFKKRIECHLKGKGSVLIAKAIKKYGIENFIYENLLECKNKEADKYEKEYIRIYNTIASNGYNLNSGGWNPTEDHINKIAEANKGKIISEQQRKKQSAFMKKKVGELNNFYGKYHTEETKLKISNTKKGRKDSDETRRKKSEANRGENNNMYGKTHTKEAREKISRAMKKRKWTDEQKEHARKTHKGISWSEKRWEAFRKSKENKI